MEESNLNKESSPRDVYYQTTFFSYPVYFFKFPHFKFTALYAVKMYRLTLFRGSIMDSMVGNPINKDEMISNAESIFNLFQ